MSTPNIKQLLEKEISQDILIKLSNIINFNCIVCEYHHTHELQEIYNCFVKIIDLLEKGELFCLCPRSDSDDAVDAVRSHIMLKVYKQILETFLKEYE